MFYRKPVVYYSLPKSWWRTHFSCNWVVITPKLNVATSTNLELLNDCFGGALCVLGAWKFDEKHAQLGWVRNNETSNIKLQDRACVINSSMNFRLCCRLCYLSARSSQLRSTFRALDSKVFNFVGDGVPDNTRLYNLLPWGYVAVTFCVHGSRLLKCRFGCCCAGVALNPSLPHL